MATIKMSIIIKAGEGVEKRTPPPTVGNGWWECTPVQLLWKTAWRFLKKPKIRAATRSSDPTPGKLGQNCDSSRCLHPCAHSSTVNNSPVSAHAGRAPVMNWEVWRAAAHGVAKRRTRLSG